MGGGGGGFLVGSVIRGLLASHRSHRETGVRSLGWEKILWRREMATHSRILAWIIQWTGALCPTVCGIHKDSDTAGEHNTVNEAQ